ncbi:MAG TPA: MBL fold metallo-hydrolase [Aestuariivirga sp.]|nr:MBL fold metallo-hydrolase [Aestuariivirga sp.]
MFDIAMNGTKHLVLDRRKFLSIAAGLVAAGVIPKSALALAAPYSFKQGAYDITVVSDGTLLVPLSVVSPDAKPEDLAKLLGAMVQGDKAQFEASPLLFKSGSDVILMDTGSGAGFQPTSGKIAESLKSVGVDASAITKVIFTHAHPDHLWGTLGADGKPIFANASFHVAEAEWNFWTAPDLAGKMPKDMEGMVKTTQGQLAGIKDKVTMFKPGAEVLPGINVLDTAGHTPGHVSFELAGGDGLIITADAITNPLVFFPHPDWKFGFDADHDMAIANRKKLLDMASTGKKKLLGYHWPYPGIGMAEAKDGAYVYVPAA